MDYILYPINLPDPLPCIPIPLAKDDPAIPLDLQIVIQEIYRRALYHRMLDYSRPPEPPLVGEAATWVEAQLQAVGWRGPGH
jgi:hypothetical protein